MKKLLVILCIFISAPAFAKHIVGGEIFYQWIGPGATPGTSVYRITLRLFRDSLSSGAQLDPTVNIGILDKFTNAAFSGSPFAINLDHKDVLTRSGSIPCIINPPPIKYEVGYYYLNVTLSNNQMGYWVTFQRCCRVDNISN